MGLGLAEHERRPGPDRLNQMTLEEVSDEYQAIRARWHSEKGEDRAQSFRRVQELVAISRELPDEGSELIEIELEDLVNQMVIRGQRDDELGHSS